MHSKNLQKVQKWPKQFFFIKISTGYKKTRNCMLKKRVKKSSGTKHYMQTSKRIVSFSDFALSTMFWKLKALLCMCESEDDFLVSTIDQKGFYIGQPPLGNVMTACHLSSFDSLWRLKPWTLSFKFPRTKNWPGKIFQSPKGENLLRTTHT